ncbi:MAG: hypothetical protein KDC95_17020 [Planctomycetes bacterium]|nr:hypothetical protein [Planctomycetota bacterium]
MRTLATRSTILTLLLTAPLSLGMFARTATGQDDFQREKRTDAKAALEGKPAPALSVTGWANTSTLTADGIPTLAALRGKVVLLKFWGVW